MKLSLEHKSRTKLTQANKGKLNEKRLVWYYYKHLVCADEVHSRTPKLHH